MRIYHWHLSARTHTYVQYTHTCTWCKKIGNERDRKVQNEKKDSDNKRFYGKKAFNVMLR